MHTKAEHRADLDPTYAEEVRAWILDVMASSDAGAADPAAFGGGLTPGAAPGFPAGPQPSPRR